MKFIDNRLTVKDLDQRLSGQELMMSPLKSRHKFFGFSNLELTFSLIRNFIIFIIHKIPITVMLVLPCQFQPENHRQLKGGKCQEKSMINVSK